MSSVEGIVESPHGAVSFALIFDGDAAFVVSNPAGCFLWAYKRPGFFKKRTWMSVRRFDSLADARASLGIQHT